MDSRATRIVAAFLFSSLFAIHAADAKKKKHGGGNEPPPSDSGGTMTFTPEDTGQAPAAGGDTGATTPPPADTGAPAAPKPRKKAVAAGPPPTAGTPSKTMERAIKLYDNDDFYSATIELNKVIEGQTGDDEGNKQRAEFYMGKALFNLKYYSASLSYFDRIVQKGGSHAYYAKTLQWLASLQQFLPDSAGVLEKIGSYSRDDLDNPALEPVRDQLFFLLGRYHYSKSNFKDAIDLFEAVPEKSEFYARAKFFEGITYVRQYQAKPAAESFKAILRKNIEDPDKSSREFEGVANLALARTFYSLHDFDKSIKYYDKIPQESPDWLPSLFESSWSLYNRDGYSKALGNIHTLNSPYFENEFFPESIILKALMYFERCQFTRAMEAIVEFNSTYPQLKKDIDRVIAHSPDNAEFYDYVVKIKNGEANLSDRVQRAAAGALSDKTLAKNIDYVNELARELRSVEKADPAWRSTAIASNILQDLTLQQSLAKNEAGNLARERLKRLSNEIQEQVKQSIKVEYETLAKQKGEIQASIGTPVTADKNKFSDSLTGGEVVVDDEHERWPFDGEYWKDELGYYRFRILNKCKAK